MTLKRCTGPQASDGPIRMNQKPRKCSPCDSRIFLMIGLLLFILGFCRSSEAQQDYTYNPNHFDTAKIIQAMKTPHSDLRIVSAHRGLHAKFGDDPTSPGIPENSISSVEAAAKAGLELMEIDVKLTSDNIPICSHDLTWGRETNPSQAGGSVFDPFSDPSTPTQRSLNPRVDSLTAAATQAQFNMRDSVSFLPNYGPNFNVPATLQNIIDRINQDQIASVLAIDVKDVKTFHGAWTVVSQAKDWNGNPFAGHVVWKVSGFNYLTPAAFKADFPDYASINYWPNYNTGQIAPGVFGSESEMISSLNGFWSDPSISMIAPEITQKQPNGILNVMRSTNVAAGHTVAEFAAYKDYVYPNDSNQTAQFFWTGGTDKVTGAQLGGSCCVSLRHYFFNPVVNEDGSTNPDYDSTRPSDTADDRGDFDFVVNQTGFNVITTDDVLNWANQLTALNLRNLSYMQKSGFGGDPRCNAGPGEYPGCEADRTTVFTYCVAEGGTCSFTGSRVIAFGANGHYNYRNFTNSVACNNSTLGPDPIGGVAKACYYGPAYGAPTGQFGQPAVYCADEGGTCIFNGTAAAIIGVGGGRLTSVFRQNSFVCDTGGLDVDNPNPSLRKTCFYQLVGDIFNGPTGYVLCAKEGQTCQFAGTGKVAFGANGSFSYLTLHDSSSTSGIPCNNSKFVDLLPGVPKACYYEFVVPVSSQSGSDGGGGVNPNQTGLTSSGDFFGPGEPNGNIPSLSPSNSATFTVQAGGTSFTVSQPNDSVATYTWTDGGTPTEVLTSASGSGLGYALTTVAAGTYSGAQPSATITVDASTTFQTIDGFGGAMTDSAAFLILGSPNSNKILQTLFGTGTGQAGLTMVRSPMGSSDLMASPNDIHTYEDTRSSFSSNGYESDQRQITALQQAKVIAGSNFKLLGTPWSAPGWAKRGGSLLPTQCGTDQNELTLSSVNQYAAYFANYIHTYSSAGLTPWAVSMQNEPENCKTAMPTTLMSATDEVALSRALKSTIPSDVKVLGWDHNWNDPDYVDTLVGSGSVDAIGYHCYDGTHYSNQTQSLPTYMTECSGFTASSSNVAANLGWEVANLLIGPLRYGSRGSIYWTLAQDPNGNPHLGSSDACQDCRGMITVNGDGNFEPSQDLYYWAQFSKFVPPGSVRIDSNNSGNLSTVAFRNGNTQTLVVLNSATTQANGGSGGSDEHDLRGHILQWDGDNSAQKTAWLVGSDGYRRWISDGSTFNCLVYDAGKQGPYTESSGALDKYINLLYVWAVCGQVTLGTNSELETGTYLKSTNGGRLTLTASGLTATDANGNSHWAPSGTGNRLILQEDQNLVLYSGTDQVWASNTVGSGAIWLSMRDDGTFALFNAANQQVWVSQIDAGSYKGKIVQWEGDASAQKTSWFVGWDGKRRWIPDLPTFQCLHDAGAGNALSLSTEALNQLPNLNNVWEACGGSQIGANGTLELGSHLQAGTYSLTQTANALILGDSDQPTSGLVIWGTSTGGYYTILQPDGNLAQYGQAGGAATWATATNNSNPGFLILGTDGSLRLWDASGNNVWSRTPGEVPTAPASGYNYCGAENSTCKFDGVGRVLFGAPGAGTTNFTSTVVTNSTACSNSALGPDPAPGRAKFCWYSVLPK